ncbi:MAG: hypothetical protein BWY63_00418 [Chloroflexi bacterium ADurb.Bin360]|nr:MAG: hypothetical protein BWY63_00418 [Chloroflexi bacterium ADurb.Bin360]
MIRFGQSMKQMWRASKLPLLLVVGIPLVGCLLYVVWVIMGWSLVIPPSMKNIPTILTQAPCVADVCIGMTGRDLVIEKLSQSGLLYGIHDSEGMPIGFSIHEGGSGQVLFADNGWKVVSGLELRIKGVALKTVLDVFGEPDEIFLMLGCGRAGEHIHARLFYRDKGIEVILQYPATRQIRRDRGAQIVFDDHTPVLSVQYFDPAQYNEWLLGVQESIHWSGYFSLLDPSIFAETIVNRLQPWPGLGVKIEAFDSCARQN